MKRFFLIIFLSAATSANQNNSNFNKHVYNLANEIFWNYFNVFKCVTYASDDVNNFDFLENVLPVFVINLSTNGVDNVLREAFEQGCGGVLVQTAAENRQKLVSALLDAKHITVSYRYNKERYLFLPVSENDTDIEILMHDSMFFLPNFIQVSASNITGEFYINGHTVFDPGKTNRVEVLDIWKLSKGFSYKANLYPDKIKNVKGKQLIFGLMHYIPYSVIVKEKNKTIYDGVETRIAAQFVETINGTFDGLDHPIEMWGDKFPNGSGNGIFGSVQRHEADLGYSAIYQWYCDVLDCSYPYIQAEVICLVPKPKILANWATILLPFSVSTWIGLVVSYFVSSCFVLGISLLSKRIKGNEITFHVPSMAFQSAFNVYRLQMQQIPRFAHKNHSIAVYFKIALFYYFLISIFWQGGISSILTIPRYEKPIDSALDLVTRWPKVEWGSNHDVWIHSIENATEPVLYNIVKKFKILETDVLIQRTKQQDFAYFLEKLPNNHYGFSDHINEETVPRLRLMKDNIYTGFAVIILPRGSPYTEKLDHVIHWLFATGMTQKMEIQVSLERINNHLQNMIRYSNEKTSGRVILTTAHIQGPLYLYVGGIVVSVLAFVVEVLVAGKFRKTKVVKI